MADLVTLEQSLRSAKEKLTNEELKLLWKCKSKALREFTGGVVFASVASYAASSRLNNRLLRLTLAGGAGYIGGFWCFSRSLDSCAEAILSLDGSRIQKELANIIVKTHPNNEWKMQHVTKYFYSERVFDDSNDMPKLRWRYRNFFSDTIADGQRSQGRHSDDDSHGDDQGDNHGNSNSGSYEEPNKVSDNKLNGKSAKQASVTGSSSTEVVEDPLDCVFGSATTTEEVNHVATSSTSPRIPTRSNKRLQRKQRRRLREANMQDS